MTVELWGALAAVFLAAAGVSAGLALFGVRGPWRRAAVAARAGGLVPLGLALVLAVAAHGEPSPFDLRQLALGSAVAMVVTGLGLAWRRGTGGSGPVHDVVAVSLVLAAVLAIQPGGTRLDCVQRSLPFWSYWGLFVVGAGSLLLAAGMVLDLALGALVAGGEPSQVDAYRQPVDAASIALVAIGAGLAISAWWSWRTAGSLLSGDPRQTWLAATWLVDGMGLLAWPLERGGTWVAAALSVVAAVMALLGLLAVPEIWQLWGL